MATWRKREDLELEVECGVDSALVRFNLDKLDKAGWLHGVRVYIQTSWEEIQVGEREGKESFVLTILATRTLP